MRTKFSELFSFNWRYKKYQLFIINTETTSSLYLWENWSLFLQPLNELIYLTPEKAFIRSFQSHSAHNKWLGFGRMKWNEENNRKWTGKYRDNVLPAHQPDFYHTQIWAPDWNKVYDTGTPPDIFINLYNYPNSDGLCEGIIIALPKRHYKMNKEIVDDAVHNIALCIPNSKIHHTTRDWWGRTALRNNIEHMNPQEIRKIVDPVRFA
jgi:hypothetical protein